MIKDIYFINVDELSKKIRSGEVDGIVMFKHFVFFNILFYSGFVIPVSIQKDEVTGLTWSMLVAMFIVEAIINYYGIWYTYQVNRKGDGKDYFERLFCIALPISVRLFLLTILVGVSCSIIVVVMSSVGITFNGAISSALYTIALGAYSMAFYYLAGKYMRVCSGGL